MNRAKRIFDLSVIGKKVGMVILVFSAPGAKGNTSLVCQTIFFIQYKALDNLKPRNSRSAYTSHVGLGIPEKC